MGDLLDLLKDCPLLAPLGATELQAVAQASYEVTCDPSQPFFSRANGNGQMYVLEDGKVAVWVSLQPGARCGGQATAVIDQPGQAFGWSVLAREDRLTTQARCIARTRMIVVNLRDLAYPVRLKVFRRLAAYLFAYLQELGLCPFNLAGLVMLSNASRE